MKFLFMTQAISQSSENNWCDDQKQSDIYIVKVKIYWLSFWLIQMLHFAMTSVNLHSIARSFSSFNEERIAWNYISCALQWRVDMLTVSLSSLFIEWDERVKIFKGNGTWTLIWIFNLIKEFLFNLRSIEFQFYYRAFYKNS